MMQLHPRATRTHTPLPHTPLFRSPIREPPTIRAREGCVRAVPRRGIFGVRKPKAGIIEMIIAWAALESMAARLAAARATSEELHALRQIFEQLEDEAPAEQDRKSTRLNSSH